MFYARYCKSVYLWDVIEHMCYTYLFTKQICLIFHFITCGFINFNHINWKNKGEKNRNKANSSDPTINKWHSIFMQRFLMSAYFHKRLSNSNCHLLFTSKIWNTAIPFSRAIVFTNLGNIESVLKLLPDLLSHSVSKHHSDFMFFLIFTDWSCK